MPQPENFVGQRVGAIHAGTILSAPTAHFQDIQSRNGAPET